MSNYQKILTSIRRMTGAPYYQQAFHLQNPWAYHTHGFKTPDRAPFGTSIYEGVQVPTALVAGTAHGRTHIITQNNREFIGVAPNKGVYGGLADGT